MISKKILISIILVCSASLQALPTLNRLKHAVTAAADYFGNKACAEKSFFTAIADGDVASVKRLLRQYPCLIHAELLVKNGAHTPMSCTVYYDQPQVMTALLDADKSYLEKTIPLEGEPTPLIYALLLQRPVITKMLLDYGAKVNYVLEPGNIQKTPLMWAVCIRSTDFVQLLLEKGADPNLGNCYASPLALIQELLCDEATRIKIICLLKAHGATK